MSQTDDERFFEPFLYLVDVTDTSALVSWGGFFLARTDDGWGIATTTTSRRRPPGGRDHRRAVGSLRAGARGGAGR